MARPASLSLYPQVKTRLPEIQIICQRRTLQFAYLVPCEHQIGVFRGLWCRACPDLRELNEISVLFASSKQSDFKHVYVKKVFGLFTFLFLGVCSRASLAEKLTAYSLQKASTEGSVRVSVMLHDEPAAG